MGIAVHQKEKDVNAAQQNAAIVNAVHLIPVNAVHQKEKVVNAVHQKEKHVNAVHLKVILKVENSAQLKAMLAVPHKVVVVLLIKTKVPLQKDVILKEMDVVNYRNLIKDGKKIKETECSVCMDDR